MSDTANFARECLAGYDRWALTYDGIDNPAVALSAEVLKRHLRQVTAAHVLELGCGTGRNGLTCLAAGAQSYAGIDGSPGMIEAARRRIGDARASFFIEDLQAGSFTTPGHPGAFDFALVCLVLEHFPDVTPIIAGAAGRLAPGGVLVVIELHPELHERGIRANFRDGDREIFLPSFRHDAGELTVAARGAGLVVSDCRDHEPTAAALAQSPKLARYVRRPVLLELVAGRPPHP
jgi:SAM-dependent methyltransferase